MSRKYKKSDDEKKLAAILLVTAILNLIQAIVETIRHLLE